MTCAIAQTPSRFVGTVQAVRPEAVEVKTDQGDVVTAKTISETVVQRVAPGVKDLKQAETIPLSDVGGGDRVLVTLEPGTQDLRRLVVMAASDISRRNEADRLDWQKRGVSGIVASVKGNDVTVRMRSLMGETQAVVTVTARTSYRRYAPDSVRFADARASALSEIGAGDQLRARGVKSEDGLKVTAEEVVFGTFLTKAGKVTSVDTAAKLINVVENGTNKPLTIRIAADSQLKRMPDFSMMGGGPPGGMPPGGMPGGRPGAMPGAPGAGMGMGMGMRPPDMSQMLERMPAAKLEDLQPGQTVVVSSTKGQAAGEVTAIMLVANADMLLRMASMQGGQSRGAGQAGGMPGGMGMGGGMMGGMGGGLEGMQLPGIMP